MNDNDKTDRLRKEAKIDDHGVTISETDPSQTSSPQWLATLYVLATVLVSVHFFHGRYAIFLTFAVVVAVLIRNANYSRIRLMVHDWLYLVYWCFLVASAFWSVSPQASLEQALPLILPWLGALALSSLRAEWVANRVVTLALAATLFAPLVFVTNRDLAIQERSTTGGDEWRGIFYHQLLFGGFLTVALGLFLISVLNRPVGRKILRVAAVFLILGIGLFLARARLFVGWGLLALALTILLSKRSRGVPFRAVLAISAIILVMTNLAPIRGFLNERGFDFSLTGRTNIWRWVLRGVSEDSAVFGHGFGTLQLPTFDYLFPGRYRPDHAHSLLIQSYFETGTVGTSLLLLLIFSQIAAAWRLTRSLNVYSYTFFMVFYCALSGLTSGVYAVSLTTPVALMLLFLAIESRSTKRDGVRYGSPIGSPFRVPDSPAGSRLRSQFE